VTDLYLATAISLALSAVLCTLSLHLARHLSRPTATAIVLLTTAFLFFHSLYLLDDLRATRLLPFSGAVILANLSPLAVAIIVGVGWNLVPGGKLRKGLILMPLVGVSIYKAYAPAFPVEPLTLGDRWDHGICRQTTKATCSPAAAATLLYHYGIRTTEQEMASLCRTTPQGTSMLGLYRGLKLKTAGTPWDVEVFHGPAHALRGLGGAMIASVGLRKSAAPNVDPRYEKEWGWPPGVKHTVVLFDSPTPEVEIGDPAVGRERWTQKDLETLWYDEGLRLIKRK
jgi:hypothetical protein